jgi:hypothetical protein
MNRLHSFSLSSSNRVREWLMTVPLNAHFCESSDRAPRHTGWLSGAGAG